MEQVISPGPDAEISASPLGGVALRNLAMVFSMIGWVSEFDGADDARTRAASRTTASLGSPRPKSVATMRTRISFSAAGSGVTATTLPAAFFAHHPAGGVGISFLRQILCRATSERPNSLAKCVMGLDQTSSWNSTRLYSLANAILLRQPGARWKRVKDLHRKKVEDANPLALSR